MFGRRRKRSDKPAAVHRLGEVRALDRVAPPGPKVHTNEERRPLHGAPEDPV